MSPEEKRAFEAWIKANGEQPLRHRSTRENIASHLDGHLRLDGAGVSVAAIQEAAGFPQGRKKGPLFGLLGDGKWGEEAVRVLAACAAADAPRALALDLSEYRSGGSAYEVLSLHSVHDGFTSPLDWRRVRIESEEAEEDVEGRCRELALQLLDGCHAILAGEYLTAIAAKLPVVSRQQALAENSPLRPALAGRGVEYALGITTEYNTTIRIDAARSPVYAETLPETPFLEPHGVIRHGEGAAIGLRDTRVAPGGPFLDEHLVQIGEHERRYFVARGRLEQAPRLPAYRLARRSIEIAEAAARLPTASLADPFGVAFFNHPSDECWRRHMLLLSLYERFRLEEHRDDHAD